MSQPATDPTCDRVTAALALGEPLGDLAEHVTTCARCARAREVAQRLVATHAAVDPGLGFAARMTAGAQHRIIVRRRRRVAGGIAAAVAACALGVVATSRLTSAPELAVAPAPVSPSPGPAAATGDQPRPDPTLTPPAPHAADPEVRALVHLANIDRDLRGSARWGRIEKPLRPYRSLVQGVSP